MNAEGYELVIGGRALTGGLEQSAGKSTC